MKYVIIASAFSGNQGAASMLEASIQTITKKDSEAEFTLFSMYPEQDERLNHYDNVQILNAKPIVLGGFINPLTLLYKILVPLRPIIKKQKHVNALVESKALLDQGGITFVDGRGKFIIYNLATILPGIFTNTPVIKCSQAMGPFNDWYNNLAAKIFLPKMKAIFSRGTITDKYLKDIKLKNVTLAADYAFLMGVSKQASETALIKLSKKGVKPGKLIGLLPSEVVRKKYEKSGGDYAKINQDFIKHLIQQGYEVMLLPHSTRFGTDDTHNNDLPVCRAIADGINDSSFHFVDEEITAQEVRSAIGICDVVVTSRFHAMVSALSTKTPALIVGWSHKYKEVMDMFELADCAVDSSKLNLETLVNGFNNIYKTRADVTKKISKNLPKVLKSSQKQVDFIVGKY